MVARCSAVEYRTLCCKDKDESSKGHLKDTIMNRDYENMTLIEAILLGCQRGLMNFAPVGVVWKWLSKSGK
jgi:hypothetical protein